MQASVLGKAIYVGAVLTMTTVGAVNVVTKTIKDAPLGGVETTAPVPSLTAKTIWNDTFQQEAVEWFQQHWGLRGYAVRTDVTIGVRLFGETRGNGESIVGLHDVLFTRDDIRFTNRDDRPDKTIAMAHRFVLVQQALQKRGITFIPVVMPSKTSFFADAIPPAWRRRGAHRRSDENLYGAFVRTLRGEGASFVDARAILAKQAERPEDIFTTTGHHWRAGPACRVFEAVVDVARTQIPELGNEPLDCHVTTVAPSEDAEEYDIYNFLNVWGPLPSGVDVEVYSGRRASPALKVPTLFVGSSFLFRFTEIAQQLDVLLPSALYYYDTTIFDVATTSRASRAAAIGTRKVQPFTDAWRQETFGKRLFVMGVLETFLPDEGKKFIEEMERELGICAQNLK